MGQEVERVLLEDGKHEIISVQCKTANDPLDVRVLSEADVVIDFTSAEAVPAHIATYCQVGIDVVMGTTGWNVHDVAVQEQVKQSGIGLIVGSNFSVGMQVFLQLIAEASRLFYRFGSYDVYGIEQHHAAKKDSPSGTSKVIAQTIMEHFPSKTTPNFERATEAIMPQELHFASVRGGHNKGTHEVIFDSVGDEVRLTHTAHSRRGFAEGAVLAAEYIHSKHGLIPFEQLFRKGGPYAA